jgi:tetratricopeptide (TPR) repeat protein
MAHYSGLKEYDKAIEAGEKILKIDPDSFSTASYLVRVAQEKGDTLRMFAFGEQTGQIVQRYKASAPPEGMAADAWEKTKADTQGSLADQVNYVAYSLFNAAYQTRDAAQRAALLERFVLAFPDSPYSAPAQQLVAAAYQQAQNIPKMLEFANAVLARDPDSTGMLILLADHLSEKNEQLDKAEAYAKKALEVLAKAEKPANLTDEQWATQKSLQQGLAHSSIGQIYMHQKKLPLAVESLKAASPLLKADPNTYVRNLLRLGNTYVALKNTAEARKAFTEAAGLETPYKSYAQEMLAKTSGAPAKKRR